MRESQSYHVEWFITREARSDVTVRIDDGRLTSVESGRAADAIDLGSVAMIDGLVNAHTHLEFSGFASPIPTAGRFTDWIRSVVAHRRANPGDLTDTIRSGLQESLESGTTLVGDIATSNWTRHDYAVPGICGVVFHELLGLLPERIAQQHEIVQSLRRNIDAASAEISGHPDAADMVPSMTIGISPHAPYSTHLEIVRAAVDIALETGCPLAMHLAETRAELELLADRTGEFREMLTDFGIWRDDPAWFGRRPLDYLEVLAKAPRSLIVHGNYLDDDELKFLAARPQMTLVYCPRTHAAFGHSEHPWRRALELGVRVALGTDSRASNPDLSLFAELQFLAARSPDVSHIELLQLGSSAGRSALGFDQRNEANFTLIRLEDSARQLPHKNLFSPANRACGTMVAGQWAWLEADLREMCRNAIAKSDFFRPEGPSIPIA